MESSSPFLIVIDDDQDVLAAMAMALEAMGFEVCAASSAEAAVSRLAEFKNPPSVVIADYRLAGSRLGPDAIRLIRKAVGVAVPGIIFSADTSPDRIHEAQKNGFRILHKPVTAEVLKTVITAVLGRGS